VTPSRRCNSRNSTRISPAFGVESTRLVEQQNRRREGDGRAYGRAAELPRAEVRAQAERLAVLRQYR